MSVKTSKSPKSSPEFLLLVRIGVDLSKDTFHVVGLDEKGHRIFRKKFTRESFKTWLGRPELPRMTVAMESCGGAQWWGSYCQAQGHVPMLIPPHQVKPFATSQKNDFNDAEAICEASFRPRTTKVPVKTPQQQDLAMVLAARSGIIKERTALASRIRAFLLERGVSLPRGIRHLQGRLSEILDDGTNALTQTTRSLLRKLQVKIRTLTEEIDELDREIKSLSGADKTSRILQTMPGIGPIVAAAMIAVIGHPARFRNGRDMSAYLGLVPSQHTSGDKIRLGKITKRGDSGLRSLLVEGARAAILAAERTGSGKMKDGKLRAWILALKARKESNNKIAVAVANKMVRTAYALWMKETAWRATA